MWICIGRSPKDEQRPSRVALCPLHESPPRDDRHAWSSVASRASSGPPTPRQPVTQRSRVRLGADLPSLVVDDEVENFVVCRRYEIAGYLIELLVRCLERMFA